MSILLLLELEHIEEDTFEKNVKVGEGCEGVPDFWA